MSCCCCCCSPFDSFPHWNEITLKMKIIWEMVGLIVWTPVPVSAILPNELHMPWCKKSKKIWNLAADLGPVLVESLVPINESKTLKLASSSYLPLINTKVDRQCRKPKNIDEGFSCRSLKLATRWMTSLMNGRMKRLEAKSIFTSMGAMMRSRYNVYQTEWGRGGQNPLGTLNSNMIFHE